MVFVVEQNRDAQMRTLLINELDVDPAGWCRCCTTTARRSPRASSPAAITGKCMRGRTPPRGREASLERGRGQGTGRVEETA
jgi:hypothetical protein